MEMEQAVVLEIEIESFISDIWTDSILKKTRQDSTISQQRCHENRPDPWTMEIPCTVTL